MNSFIASQVKEIASEMILEALENGDALQVAKDLRAEIKAGWLAALETHRERLGLTQAELAALLDVPARTHWEWESGNTTPHAITQEGAIARLSKSTRRSEATNTQGQPRPTEHQ